MTYEHKLSDSEVLSDTRIDFYGNPDVQFHVNTGRDFESKKKVDVNENGNKVEKQTINTMPCPTVDVYDMDDGSFEILVHLPTGNPIIIDWFTVTNEFESFMNGFVGSLDDGYNGIDEVTSFNVQNGSESLGDVVRQAILNNTPYTINVPQRAPM